MDDLVAELTLKLRNEMSAGVEEIRQEFNALDGTLGDLGRELGAFQEELNSLSAPAGLVDGFAEIGREIDADIGKIHDMQTALTSMYDAQADLAAAGGGGSTGGRIVPPAVPGPPKPEDDDDDKPSGKKHGIGDGASMVGDLILAASGYDSAQHYAEINSVLAQITNTEKLHGADAVAEQDRLLRVLPDLALKYNQNSDDLIGAYKFLITTGLKPAEVDALMPSLAEGATAHGLNVSDLQGAVFALADSYKIKPEDMGEVLGQLGYATKMGHFGADSFGAYLPVIGGALATAGVTGEGAADSTFAALETIIKNVSIPSEAATDYVDMIHYVGTQHAMRTFMQMSRMMMPQMRSLFDKYDVAPADLLQMQNDALAEGKDPIQTVLDYVHAVTAKMTPTDRNAVISDYFTNQQGGDAVRALMLHWDDSYDEKGNLIPGYQSDIKTLRGVNQKTLDDDFASAVQSSTATMHTFDENLRQLNYEFGSMFTNIVARGANLILSPGAGPDQAGGLPGTRFMPPHPIEIHLKVSGDGTVTGATQTNPQPGVNVRVNQGAVLNNP